MATPHTLQRGSDGKCKRRPSGKLARSTSGNASCCCDRSGCQWCEGGSPDIVSINVGSIVLCEGIGDDGGHCVAWLDVLWSWTGCLTRPDADGRPCYYEQILTGTDIPDLVVYPTSDDCSCGIGGPFGVEASIRDLMQVTIGLDRTIKTDGSGDHVWSLAIYMDITPEALADPNFPNNFPYGYGVRTPIILFAGEVTVTEGDCSTDQLIENRQTGCGEDSTGCGCDFELVPRHSQAHGPGYSGDAEIFPGSCIF